MGDLSHPHWSNSSIHHLSDIYDNRGLCSFQEIKSAFNLPGSSFFFYLQLRSALKAHGVPWQQPIPVHPLYKLLTVQGKNRGMVSTLYNFFLEASYDNLQLDRVWRRDCPVLDTDFSWEGVWSSIKEASRNPDHQQIHFNYVHRTYLTPRKLHCMKLIDDPSCSLCTMKALGTFMHMMWDCPPVTLFWTKVASGMSRVLSVTVPVTAPALLLNDLSKLNITKLKMRILLAGLTAAKKMVAVRWKPPNSLTFRHWVLASLDVVYLELSTARINRANDTNGNNWCSAVDSFKDLLE